MISVCFQAADKNSSVDTEDVVSSDMKKIKFSGTPTKSLDRQIFQGPKFFKETLETESETKVADAQVEEREIGEKNLQTVGESDKMEMLVSDSVSLEKVNQEKHGQLQRQQARVRLHFLFEENTFNML